jgi:hypothetical protein
VEFSKEKRRRETRTEKECNKIWAVEVEDGGEQHKLLVCLRHFHCIVTTGSERMLLLVPVKPPGPPCTYVSLPATPDVVEG